MADILQITEILTNVGDVSLFILVVAVILAVIIGVAEYKDRFWEYLISRRNKWRHIFWLLLLALIVFLYRQGWLYGLGLTAAIILCVGYAVLCLFLLRPRKFQGYWNPLLKKYEMYLKSGCSAEHIGFFRKTHWYIFLAVDKIDYHLLACTYYDDVNEYENAYKELGKIKDNWLYKEERNLITTRKAFLLMKMGHLKGAFHLIGDPEKSESTDPMIWSVYSFIYENEGNYDVAFKYAEKSRDMVTSLTESYGFTIAEVYNNYSRIAYIKGNRGEAMHYLDLAWEQAKKLSDLRILHIVASNRIYHMALNGRSREECEKALSEYKKLIPNDSVKNQLEYNNCAISYYRQIQDCKMENALLHTGYCEIIEKIDHNQKISFTACTFRMLMNGKYTYRWLSKYVKTLAKEYKSLSLLEKLAVFKEYMGVFQQDEFRVVCNHNPYKQLRTMIMKYYQKEAIRDINDALEKVEHYNVYQYLTLMQHKLSILKILEGKEHIKKSKDLYIELYKELYDAGLHIDAVNVLMILMDESTSPYNTLIWGMFWSAPMYFSDYIANSQPPDPQYDPDGIHLRYYYLQIPEPSVYKPLQNDVIQEHIDDVIREFRTWKNHPVKVELSVGIARLLICIDRREEAREFIQFYGESGVSENHMASWLRDHIHAIEHELQVDRK